jgi:hypothetical protein
VDGRAFNGKVTIDANGDVQLESDDAASKPWLAGQLESIAMHRRAEAHEGSKPVLRFAFEADEHPLGRLLIFEGGRFASSYRIKDRQITVVNRHVGKTNMTITTLDNELNREGRFLPRSYVVQSWDADTGKLRRVETVQDRWVRVGSFDLPASRTVTAVSDGAFSVRTFRLTEHTLGNSKSG